MANLFKTPWAVPARTRNARGAAALALIAALSAWGLSAPADSVDTSDSVELSLPEAQALAVEALKQNRPKLAYRLSEGLLQANPRDGRAHYTQALAFAQVKAYGFGRKSARKAFNTARTPVQKYEAAHLASQMAYADDRLTLSQFWLRRAVQHAPTEEVRKDSIKAFRTVRAHNPLNFNLKFSVSPSDNVNNGSNSPYNIIDGVPVVGVLSPSAQAIDGIVATTDLQGSYRIAYGERFMTRLTGRAYTRQVKFNNAVPGLSGSDISSTRLQVGLNHILVDPSKRGQWEFDLTGGRIWYGDSPLYDFARLGVERHNRLGENTHLSFGSAVEFQEDETWPYNDAIQYEGFAQLSYKLANGARIGGYLNYRTTDTDGVNQARDQWTGIVSYTMGREIGPAKLSFQLGHSIVDYDTYRIIGPVPGGRSDNSTFGGVTASFQDWSYMGFVPTVSLNTEATESNISRFDVDETSVSFGIRSEF